MMNQLTKNLLAQSVFSTAILRSFAIVKRYTKDHEWVNANTDSKIGTVGISDHASHELGDIVYIEIPEVGQQIQKGDSVGSIESVKIAASMGSPASGTVTKVNSKIAEAPAIVNKNPEKEWMYEMTLSNIKELDELMSKEKYDEFLKTCEKHH